MELNFTLSEREATIMINSLAKEPYNLVVDIIAKIQLQASEQMKKETV